MFSPGSPTSMDRLLAGESSWMDVTSDLPLLPMTLLPLPDHCVLPLEPVAALSPPVAASPGVAVPADMSLEGPFEVPRAGSTPGDAPLMSDNLPGCLHRMTPYEQAELADLDPVQGLQLLIRGSWSMLGHPSRRAS